MEIANNQGYKNPSDLAAALNYESPEKLYRLKRNENATPSFQILLDVANLFENEDIRWLVTGKKRNTLYPTIQKRIDLAADPDVTPDVKSVFVSPKSTKIVSPTVSPTQENCKICEEKERLIDALQSQVRDQQKTIDFMCKSLEVLTNDGKKQAG